MPRTSMPATRHSMRIAVEAENNNLQELLGRPAFQAGRPNILSDIIYVLKVSRFRCSNSCPDFRQVFINVCVHFNAVTVRYFVFSAIRQPFRKYLSVNFLQ